MQTININIAKQTENAPAIKVSADILQKIGMFAAILSCVILAVNI